MSELKERDARELVINNHYLPNEESMRVYLKSEADKVIAEKDKEIKELKEKVDLYKRGWKENDRINAWLYKTKRHSNYRRCLAMAWWCRASAVLEKELDAKPYQDYYERWFFRWLKLAEQFKDKEGK